MTTCEKLLAAAADIWEKYNSHPFVLGLQNGTLDREKFRFYMVQDYLYLKDYAKNFAIGVAKAKSAESAHLFAKYIAVMDGEMDVHSGYFAEMGITQDEVDSAKMALDNISYNSYMLRVAYEEGEAEILAAIMSCAYSYEVIAKNMLKAKPDCLKDNFYGKWIEGYISQSYSDGNRVLMDALDKMTENYSEAQINRLCEIFTICSKYEMSFWDMCWNMKL